MRNILLTIICGLFVFSLAYCGNFLRGLYDENKGLLSPIINLGGTPSPASQPKNVLDLDSGLRIVWTEVEDLSKISVYPNLEDHKTAKTLHKEKQCKTLVNGGFYSEADKHIGLFVSNGNRISNFESNSLFNGVFSISSESAQIRTTDVDAHNAVQAGPILVFDSKPHTLSIKNDENERRVIVAKTNDGKVLFLIIYKKDSAYLGPKLSDVPKLLQEFTQETDIEIVSALNLDGGTASAFYSDGVSLGELTKIGSYFCVSG